VIRLVALIVGAYALYTLWRAITDPAWVFVPVAIFGVVTSGGLAARARWSEPLAYAFLGLVAGTWIAIVAAGAVMRRPAAIELVPGAVLVLVCAGATLAVFRHFHPRR
jgi:hypothetical protein